MIPNQKATLRRKQQQHWYQHLPLIRVLQWERDRQRCKEWYFNARGLDAGQHYLQCLLQLDKVSANGFKEVRHRQTGNYYKILLGIPVMKAKRAGIISDAQQYLVVVPGLAMPNVFETIC